MVANQHLVAARARVSRRIRARRRERGAAVFVVVLAITMLTAVGLFAAHSATLVDQAAGYARMARQTQYLAEYGTLASAAELGSGTADVYYQQLLTGADACRANARGKTTGLPCYRMAGADLNVRTQALSGESLIEDQTGAEAGFIGYTADGENDGVIGDFVVELTDPGPTGAPIAGTDLGGTGPSFRYVKVTATAIAQMRPPGAACSNAVSTLTGQQALRAHLVIGPIP